MYIPKNITSITLFYYPNTPGVCHTQITNQCLIRNNIDLASIHYIMHIMNYLPQVLIKLCMYATNFLTPSSGEDTN